MPDDAEICCKCPIFFLFGFISWRVNWKFIAVLWRIETGSISVSKVAEELDILANTLKGKMNSFTPHISFYFKDLLAVQFTKVTTAF